MAVDIVNEQSKTEDVSVIIINDDIDDTVFAHISDRVNVFLIGRKPGSVGFQSFIKLNYKLIVIRPDIIHCHYGTIGKILLPCFKKVLTVHDVMCDTRYFKYFKSLYCISKAVQRYVANSGYPNAIVVYNGIHTEQIVVRQDIQGKKDTYSFISVGRLNKEKGHYLIIEAFNELVNHRKTANIRIDLIGDGTERKQLEKLTHEYGLEKHIRFLGRQPRSYFYPRLCDYDLFILASTSEGFGLTLAEATSAKVTVLTSNLPGPMEVLSGGQLGLSFESGSFMNMADKIESFCVNGANQDVLDRAWLYTSSHFDIKTTAKRYIDEYKQSIIKK